MAKGGRKSSNRNPALIGSILIILLAVLTYLGLTPGNSIRNSITNYLSSNKNNNGQTCNTTVPQRSQYTNVFYVQGAVFCIPKNQIIAMNLTGIPPELDPGQLIINGSYSASTNTEFYILNSIQYGQFLVLKDQSKNYTWYSGNNQGATINVTGLNSGDTYYLVFYTNSPSYDTIIIQRSIQASYKYN